MRTHRLPWAAVGLISICAAAACEEPRTAELTVVVRRPAYPRLRCSKGPLSLGRLYPEGEPIAGATVVLKPSNLRARTDKSGRARLARVPEGDYQLFVVANGFRPLPPRKLTLDAKQTLAVGLAPCISAGGNRLQVGFDRRVTLTAQNRCGPEWQEASYRWTQVEGPQVGKSVAAWDVRQLSFTTPSLLACRGSLPEDAQVLSFSHDQAGEHVFKVEATGPDGKQSVDFALVSATSVTSGTTSVVPYQRYYFAGPKQGPWSWKVFQPPAGWTINLEGADTRTPSVRPVPDRAPETQQNVAIRDEHSKLTFSLAFGAWNLVRRDCGRSECHAAMEAQWRATTHARSWQRLLDGELALTRSNAAESCADCHAVGYDPTAPNGGYDDVAAFHKVTFPEQLTKGNYEALPAELKDVSNVYCVACHGPARVDPPVAEQPGLFQVGVCARCHDRQPENNVVAEWRLSKHAKTVSGKLNGPDRRQECAACHTAQGYYYAFAALSRPPAFNTAVLSCCEVPAPVGCQACHNAMFPLNKPQLHRFGSATTATGLVLEQVGAGAQCVVCHNAGAAPARSATIAQRLGPHAPQTEVTYGQAGYALDAPGDYPKLAGVACATKTKDGCVTCHMHKADPPAAATLRQLGGHTMRMRFKDKKQQNIAACRPCHERMGSFDPPAGADYDGDGATEAITAEVVGLLARLKAQLDATIVRTLASRCARGRKGASFAMGFRHKIVVVDARGRDLGDCDGNGVIERDEEPFTFPDDRLLLHRAAYNYLVVTRDRSRGLHNAPFVVRLLQRTIYALSNGQAPPWTILK